MPFSDAENKNTVVEWYKNIMPGVTVDIGAGSGTYRVLIGDDIGATQWTAVEAWANYVPQYKLDELYHHVVIAEAQYVDWSKVLDLSGAPYERNLVIAGDVLEHMERDEVIDLIAEWKHHFTDIIVSIPLLHLDQASYEGNWFEIHKDHWHYEDMCKLLGAGLRESVEGPTLGYFWWSGVAE